MKSNIFLVIIGLCLGFGATAQDTSKKAKEYLKKAQAQLEASDHIYLAFTYTFENNKVSPPVVQTEKGNIAIKGDDFHLNFLGTEQIKSKSKLYTILTEDEEVQITDFEESDSESISPTKILSSYQKGYSYKIEKTVKEEGKDIVYIRLKPVASEEIDHIIVALDKTSLEIKMVQQHGNNGSITSFKITENAPNKKLPANYFIFNKADYKGFYIAE